jgi:hypothetical protein
MCQSFCSLQILECFELDDYLDNHIIVPRPTCKYCRSAASVVGKPASRSSSRRSSACVAMRPPSSAPNEL